MRIRTAYAGSDWGTYSASYPVQLPVSLPCEPWKRDDIEKPPRRCSVKSCDQRLSPSNTSGRCGRCNGVRNGSQHQ